MSDTPKARANRRNGHKSRGPKTLAGKRRASQNARRHGLNLPVLHDPALSPQIEAVARKFAGADADRRRYELACRIAEAHVDVMRVRQARLPLLEQVETDHGALAQLVVLDRYERRALSRRKSAIWTFAAAAKVKAEADLAKRTQTEKPNGFSAGLTAGPAATATSYSDDFGGTNPNGKSQ